MKAAASVAAFTHFDSSVLVQSSSQLLRDLSEGLKLLSDKQYAESYNQNKPSIGKHVRHIIEFYIEFFRYNQNDSAEPLCYDSRQRDLELETSLDSALKAIADIEDKLAVFPQQDQQIRLSAIVNPQQPAQMLSSSSQRELMYLFDHTIHHMALIKLFAEFWGVSLSKNFGLAPSTIAHEQT